MVSLVTLYKMGDLKLCNCAGCGRELAGESHRAEYLKEFGHDMRAAKAVPELVAGRINGRPHCDRCLGCELSLSGGRPGRRRWLTMREHMVARGVDVE